MTAAVELARGFVALGADTTQLGRDIDRAYGQGDRTSAAAGQRQGGMFAGAFSKGLTVAGGAAVGVAGAGLAAAFVGGFNRLKAIDDATGKLKGLGHTAQEITTIMESANKSVKGTAFGLGEAATAAATAVAAGIKPGQELTRYLTLTADAASIAGTSFDEMGSIMNGVQTNGVAMTDDLQQLADRGLPIFTWLQKEYGVSGEALSKMVSDGKVDAATFQRVIEQNIGGAAQSSGKTFSGAMKNMMASLGRFGAFLLGPIFAKGPMVFESITAGMDKVTKGASGLIDLFVKGDFTGKLTEAFGWQEDSPIVDTLFDIREAAIAVANVIGPILSGAFGLFKSALGGVVDLLKGVGGFIGEHQGLFKGIAVVIGAMLVPALTMMALNWTKNIILLGVWKGIVLAATIAQKALAVAQWALNAAMSANPIGIIIALVAGLVAGLVYFFTQTELGRKVWGNVWGFIKNAVSAAWEVIKPIWDGFLNGVQWIGEKLLWLWQSVIQPVFGIMGQLISAWWNNIVKPAFSALTTVLGAVGQAFSWLWDTVLHPIINAWGAIFGWLWNTVLSPIFGFISERWSGLATTISMVWDSYIKPVFEAIGNVFKWVWDTLLQPVFNWFKENWDAWSIIIPYVWENKIKPVFEAIGNVFQNVWNSYLRPTFDAIKDGINVVGDVFKWVWENLIKPTWDRLGDGIRWVADNIIKPAFDGIKTALSAVGDFFGKIVEGIKRHWDGLKAAVAVPINFVIETVWNGGLLKAWNKVAEFLPGLEPMQPLSPVAFDKGGATHGRRGKDTIPALLGGDEHVLDRFDVDTLGGQQNVYAMRRMLELGIPFSWDAVNGLKRAQEGIAHSIATAPKGADMGGFLRTIGVPGYDKGGAVRNPWNGRTARPAWELQLENGHRAAQSRDGNPYTWGFEDCSGYMSMIADAIINGGNGVRRWATSSFPGGQPWQSGLGPGFSVFVNDDPGGPGGGHTAGTLQGVGEFKTTNVESGGSHNSVRYGGPAAGADSMPNARPGMFHLGIGADGSFMSGGGGSGPSPEEQKGFLKNKITEVIDSFFNPVKRLISEVVPAPPPAFFRIPTLITDKTRDSAVNFTHGIVGGLGDGIRTVYEGAKSVLGVMSNSPIGSVIGGLVGGVQSVFRDQGGFIQNGLTLVRNETGKPEAVLNWQQLEQVKQMMAEGKSLLEAVRSLNLPTPTAEEESSATNTMTPEAPTTPDTGTTKTDEGFSAEARGQEFLTDAGKIMTKAVKEIFWPAKFPDPEALAKRYTLTSEGGAKSSKGAATPQGSTLQEEKPQQAYSQSGVPVNNAAKKMGPQTKYDINPDAVTPLPEVSGSGSGVAGRDGYVTDIAKAAKDMGLGLYEGTIAGATALVESELKMYANKKVPESLKFPHDAVGSDGLSIGLFQQQQNGAWGTVADGMNAYRSSKLFYGALTKFNYKAMDKGAAAQKVQASAFPAKYATRMAEAERIMKSKFDTGGIVRPGLSVVENRTGQYEHMGIMTNDQWGALQDVADSGGGQSIDNSVHVETVQVTDLREWERYRKNLAIKQSMKNRGRP